MSETQILDAVLAEAIRDVFEEYATEHGLAEIADVFGKGVKIEVGDTLPSAHYERLLQRVPPAWEKAFEINPSEHPGVRAACVEFVLAGLWSMDRISRGQRFGTFQYET
jgi:magnesium chelatase subunit I